MRKLLQNQHKELPRTACPRGILPISKRSAKIIPVLLKRPIKQSLPSQVLTLTNLIHLLRPLVQIPCN